MGLTSRERRSATKVTAQRYNKQAQNKLIRLSSAKAKK
jgi:hypothetical protein